MKKRTILFLSLISIFVMVAGTAMAPAGGRSISYAGARFVGGKGAVFLFDITGVFTQQDLKTAFAYGNGGDPLDVSCVLKEELSQIACTVKNVTRYSEVLINIIGQGFWATVPEACRGFSVVFPFEPTKTYTYAWSWFGDLENWGFANRAEFFAFYEAPPFNYVFPDKCVPSDFDYVDGPV